MGRRSFSRPTGKRRYKRFFVLSMEGTVTEPEYFGMFNRNSRDIKVKLLKNKGSAPWSVLREMKRYLKEEGLQANDEAWLVVDKDQWTDNQLNVLHLWSQKNPRYGLAVSNPKFEYWLLLHFENGKGVKSSVQCVERLKKHLPNYDKSLQIKLLTGGIDDAVQRAEKRDCPPCDKWPNQNGTTVYRLAKKLI